MCEPHHSIVQYPDDDDSNNGTPGATESKLKWGLGRVADWLRKLKGFWHLSKLGSGHSESIEWAGTNRLYLPYEDTKYEARWWDRTVKLDGCYHGIDGLEKQAMEAAVDYAHARSIGSLTALRQFLEVSLVKTDRPLSYVLRFMDDFIVRPKRDEVAAKLSLLGVKTINYSCTRILKEKFASVVKVLLGYTRKREYICSAWADDAALWVPQEPKIVLG